MRFKESFVICHLPLFAISHYFSFVIWLPLVASPNNSGGPMLTNEGI
jgi:hypothetical protein